MAVITKRFLVMIEHGGYSHGSRQGMPRLRDDVCAWPAPGRCQSDRNIPDEQSSPRGILYLWVSYAAGDVCFAYNLARIAGLVRASASTVTIRKDSSRARPCRVL